MNQIRPLTRPQIKLAQQHLQNADPLLAAVIERIGPPQLHRETNVWRALSSSIIGQQISVHAARAIRGRFAAIVPEQDYPTPQQILDATDETLRGVGLSGNKVLSIRDLARHIIEDKITPQKIARLSDEEIIALLVPIRGIGRWTAEMFLLFSLHRPDVFAVDDLGLRNAMHKLYNLDTSPTPARMRELAEPWRPYRSVASWYLWRSLDNEPKIKVG